MPRIYLDVCCLNRPFDDQGQDRIRLEAEAVLLILSHIESGEWKWISSEVSDFEIAQRRDQELKARVQELVVHANESVRLEEAEVARAQQLEALTFRAFDALHLACAESGNVDVFLTTDDRLLRLAARVADRLHVRVANPLIWLKEMTDK